MLDIPGKVTLEGNIYCSKISAEVFFLNSTITEVKTLWPKTQIQSRTTCIMYISEQESILLTVEPKYNLGIVPLKYC